MKISKLKGYLNSLVIASSSKKVYQTGLYFVSVSLKQMSGELVPWGTISLPIFLRRNPLQITLQQKYSSVNKHFWEKKKLLCFQESELATCAVLKICGQKISF